jgi:subfamily B ATP-binding cassette protein MsbA
LLVRRLVRDQLRPQGGRLAFAFACMAIVAAATAGNAWLMRPVIDDVFAARDETMLFFVVGAVLALALINGAAGYFEAVLMEVIGQRMVANLQSGMYRRVIHADLAFFHDNPIGVLIARFTNDAHMLRHSVVKALTGMVKDTLKLVFLVAVMFTQEWMLALIAFVVFPVAIWPIVRIGRRMRKVSADTQTQMGELTTLLDETFQGARVVKAYGMEGYEASRADVIIETIFRLYWKAARVRALSRPVMESLGGIAVALVFLYGGWQVIGGHTTTGAFFSFIMALLLAYQPLKSIANFNANLQEGLAAAERVFNALDIEPEIVDRPGAEPLAISGAAITFEGVAFGYDENVPALGGIDLDIGAGRTVALVGASGAGKSTVFNLIGRFYDVDAGVIRIDGGDIRDATLVSLRAAIALVSQEISLFDDTVRANIAYGRPGAGEDDIVEAARNAGAHDFITELPRGYDTHVGGRGLKLSGGQRQRLAIARAMLKDAPILLLDEATSALDTESERVVQAALARLKTGRTTIVIAHRLSTVADADLIYVLERGRVAEQGSHAELLARGGVYARLHALQFADQGPPAEPRAEARA